MALKMILSGLLTVSFLAALRPPASAGQASVGRLFAASGVVSISRQGMLEPIVASVKGEELDVVVGDTVITGAGSSAMLTFTDDSFVNLGSDTAIRPLMYSYSEATKSLKAHIRLVRGGTRLIVYRVPAKGSIFLVETDTARMQVAPGDYIIGATSAETTAAVLQGFLQARNTSALAIGGVTLKRNQKTAIRVNAPPAPPELITSAERSSLTEKHTIKRKSIFTQ